MEKLDLTTPNFTDGNIQKLSELFPNCVTEADNGKAIDFDALKQELSSNIVEGNKERYQLTWPGKAESLVMANTPINKTLRPNREGSKDFDNTENLYIEGDNLEVLKLLQETYLGKIKMIYIDPPYNTGKDFVYKDNYTQDKAEYDEESGNINDEGGRLVANPDSNGRYHSDWLSMMYSRLKLARNLLKNDGVIFISIDDGEVDNLKKICNEIFGVINYVNTVCVVRSKNGLGSKEGFATNHDYFLVYKKTSDVDPFSYLRHDEDYLEKFNKEDKFGKYKMEGILRKKGAGQLREDSPGCFYPIYYNKETGEAFLDGDKDLIKSIPKLPDGRDGRWIWSKEFAKERLHRIYVSNNGTVYVKDYLQDSKRMKPKTILDKTKYTTEYATNEIKDIFGNKSFDTPKPVGLLVDLIDHSSSDKDIILDFFSGSATTAHAVMQLNAEDGGNRKFIMVQIPETTDEKSEAYKAGYKTITEIGKERICRAGEKIKKDNVDKEAIDDLDVGFRVLRVDSSNMKDVYFSPDNTSQDDMFDLASNIKDDRTDEDLLFMVLLDWGVDLSVKIECREVAGKNVYFADDNFLAACFEENLDEDFVKALVTENPLKVVLRDNGFDNDSVKINVEQIFKQANIDVKVI